MLSGIRIFPNQDLAIRLILTLTIEQSEEWTTGKMYLDVDELKMMSIRDMGMKKVLK